MELAKSLNQKPKTLPTLFVRSLDLVEMGLLEQCIEYSVYKAGDVIFKEGSAVSGLFCVMSGSVDNYRNLGKGKNTAISSYKIGECFGYDPLNSKTNHLFTAVAREESVLGYLHEQVFVQLLSNSPQLMQNILVEKAKDCTKIYRRGCFPINDD